MAYRGITGYYILQNPQKFINKNKLLFVTRPQLNELLNMNLHDFGGTVAVLKFRSKLEETIIRFIDKNKTIVSWGYEAVIIKYEFQGKTHDYWVDLIIKFQDGKVELWEIKPFEIASETVEHPSDDMKLEFLKNRAKWKSAREWCATQGYTFRILS